jgi:two-component system LytT family response regulator
MKIRTLVVDDEPLARERIQRMLHDETDVEVLGECGNGSEAVSFIEEFLPDLVFLDIQMPEMNGFEVLQAIAPRRMPPAVIFVTAYDQYAIRAFDVHALDYLLKPFNRQRFQAALNRVREQIKKSEVDDRSEIFASLLSDLKLKKQHLEKFVLKSAGRIYFLKTDEVDWIEAAGNYLKLHVGKDTHLLRETMNGIEAKLDPVRFPRIHRSTIINAERIKELFPLFNGDYTLLLKNGTELTVSRNYRSRLFD